MFQGDNTAVGAKISPTMNLLYKNKNNKFNYKYFQCYETYDLLVSM